MKRFITKIKGYIFYDLGILEKRFYWKTKKYLGKYYNKKSDIPVSQNKTLIYMLDGRAYSGGITDVIRGIISMYKFSKEINMNFRINFCFPYNLNEYLEPNSYDWHIPENEISYNSNCSIPLWIYNTHSNYGKTREFEVKFQKKILNRFIQENTAKQQFHIYTNSEWAQGMEYSVLFNELFKQAKPLQTVLNSHKRNLGSEYISMTFRFQQLLGDFVELETQPDKTAEILKLIYKTNDLNEISLPDHAIIQVRALIGDFRNKKISVPLNIRERDALIKKCINKIIEIHQNSFPNIKILVTADSEIFLKEVSKLNFVYAISAKGTDIGGEANEKYNLFLKTFTDIMMLSDANKILLLYNDLVYRSGFAKKASFINNKEYKEIKF